MQKRNNSRTLSLSRPVLIAAFLPVNVKRSEGVSFIRVITRLFQRDNRETEDGRDGGVGRGRATGVARGDTEGVAVGVGVGVT